MKEPNKYCQESQQQNRASMTRGIYSFTIYFFAFNLYVIRLSMLDQFYLTFGIRARLFFYLDASL